MKEKLTIPQLQKMKQSGERLTMVTCYDATFARLVDATDIEIVLVGDSLGMVIQGQKTTLPVTLADMVYHTRAVARGLTKPLLVADMPFMSYQASLSEAMRNAGALLKKGHAESVKIEGGEEVVELVTKLAKAGIPVMGHIGLQPQSIHKYGGYKIQGKSLPEEKRLLKEAQALEAAGCWSLVLEGVPLDVAKKITKSVVIPTIGIASGPNCDGQVLVIYDLLGMDPNFRPRFVKPYADLGKSIPEALQQYHHEVKTGVFPTAEHAFQRHLTSVAPHKKSAS